MPRITACPLLALLLVAAPAAAGEPASAPGKNLLRNGDFESGREDLPEGWQRSWFASDPSAPLLTRDGDAARAGRAGAALQPRQVDRWESLTQRIDSAPRGSTAARLSGWVRLDASDGAAARASLSITFPGPGPGSPPFVYRSRELLAPCDWTQLELEVPVPPGATAWTVGCAVRGGARASFDELTLTSSTGPTDLVGVILAVARGSYVIEAVKGPCAEPWIEFSVPLPLGGQTPLALRLMTDPPGSVTALRLLSERENRPLHVDTRGVKPGDILRLTAESFVLLADRPAGNPADARVPQARRVPDALREHLVPGPGMAPEDPAVAVAAQRMEHDDVGQLFGELRAFLEYKLSHSGDGLDHAKGDARTGMAAGAFWANLAASLLMANGLPTRLLACTGVDGALQEHYVLEAWCEKLGWLRLDADGSQPWSDQRNIVLRVVYPDAPRTLQNVPTFLRAHPGVFGGPDMNPFTLFWQSAETLGAFALTRAELAALETAAREGFEGLTQAAAEGSPVRFAPQGAEGGGAARLLAEVEARLGR